MRYALICVPLLVLVSASLGWAQSPKKAPDPLASIRARLPQTTRTAPMRVYLNLGEAKRERSRNGSLNLLASGSWVLCPIFYRPTTVAKP